MAEEKFDVIIVGAGVAGSSAAYRLAKAGLEVVLVERGPYPGAKNLSGGVLYGQVLHELIPNFWEKAPIERFITNNIISFLTADSSFNVDFKTQRFGKPPYNAVAVLRGKFDRWLAEQAEEAGAMLVPGIKVDRVLKDGSKVTGIVAGDEEMLADVVIAADGANSFIAADAGLREKLEAGHVGVGIKELIGLPRGVIEERFNLRGDEGVAYNIVGVSHHGAAGGAFFYTNKESLSIGLVMRLDDMVARKLRPQDILDEFLEHPMIAPLIEGGKLLEYGAHLVPEGGLGMMPKLYADGILVVGDAAGFGINNGFVVRGMDLAIGSGVAAADAIIEAKQRGDFKSASLSGYAQRLEKSFVMADMRTYSRAPQFLHNERLYKAYPEMLEELMMAIYRHEGKPKEHLLPTLQHAVKESDISMLDLMRDVMSGVRAL